MQATSIGDCPKCGDDLVMLHTPSHKRIAKCLNDQCKEIYALPRRGSIRLSGEVCPLTHHPVLIIIPNLHVNETRFHLQYQQAYTWAQGPCFTCPKFSSCAIVQMIKEEYH